MGQKILVVDDSRTICRVVQWVYYASSFEVEAAHSAMDALRAARQTRPDAILVDYQLPDATGFDLVRQLRSDPDLRDIPVVMLGGSYHPFDPSDVARCGADGHVMKPFTADGLMDAVSAAIAGERAPLEASSPALPAPPASAPVVMTPAVPLPALPTPSMQGVDVPPPARPELPPRPAIPLAPPAPTETPVSSMPSVPPARPLPPPRPEFDATATARPPARPSVPPPAPATSSFRRMPGPDETSRRRPMVPPPPAPLRAAERPQAPTTENDVVSVEETQATAPLPRATRPAIPEPAQTPPPAPTPSPAEADDDDLILAVEEEPADEPASPAAIPAEIAETSTPPADDAPASIAAAPATADDLDARIEALLPGLIARHNLAAGPSDDALQSALRDILPGLLRDILPGMVKDMLGVMLKQTGTKMEQYSRQKIDAFVENELPRLAQDALDR